MAPTSRTLIVLLLMGLLPACYGTPSGGGEGDDDDSGLVGDDDDDSGLVGDDDDDDDTVSNVDSDGDTILDSDEGSGDADGDGAPNSEDLDSDGDLIADEVEAGDPNFGTPPIDTDGDGTPDFLDTDSDNNGVSDTDEGDGDSDADGIPDYRDFDNDGDGIDDTTEVGANPSAPVDSDGDGAPDFLDTDSDGDGVSDADEGAGDPDGDGTPSYLDDDSDGDTLSDTVEAGADPSNPVDSAGDGFFDFLDEDSDNDGTSDLDELNGGTDPYSNDSDGDGFSDLAETLAGTDPLDPNDYITGFYAELNPRTTTTIQVPFTPTVERADVLFLLDTTGSMGFVLNEMANQFSDVVSQITIPDVAFGVATFDDYADGVHGSPAAGDKPFILEQQVTTDTAAVQSALAGLDLHDGLDGPESAMEALYQAAAGAGHDLNCDGVYDGSTDVPPFLSHSADAFAGSVSGSYDSSVAGGGTIGGAGFRPGSVPVIVYTTDAEMRDPDSGSEVPAACSQPHGQSAVASALSNIDGKLIGVKAAAFSLWAGLPPVPQMVDLANATGSVADIDGNGSLEPLVFESGNVGGTTVSTVDQVIAGISAFGSGSIYDLTLEVYDSPYDFVVDIQPALVPAAAMGVEVVFDLTLYPDVPVGSSDQVFVFDMSVVGDGFTPLATWQLVLLVRAG